MNDEQLKNLLQAVNPPQPSEKAEENAVSAALSAFENSTKGIQASTRPTGIATKIFNWILGEDAMNKKLVLKGSVAAIAILVSVGLAHQYLNMGGELPIADRLSRSETAQDIAVPTSSAPLENFTSVKTDNGKESAGPGVLSESEAVIAPSPEQKDKNEIGGMRAKVAEKKAVMQAPQALGGAAMGLMAKSADMSYPSSPPASSSVAEPMPQQKEYVGEDEFQDFKINPVKIAKEEPVSTFSIDVDTASYAFARRMINSGVLPQKDAVRVEEMINYFDYDYKAPETAETPFAATVAVHASPWKAGNKLVHIGIKGHEIVNAEKPRSNLVFLVDVSGSMSEPDKLPLAKNALKMLLDEMRPDDTISIAVYAGAAGTVLEPTKVAEKGKIIAALDNLNAGGSTAGGEGIRLAYSLAEQNFDKGAVNRVILATDGDFNVGITDHDELQDFIERKRDSGIFLSVLGFGQGNYHDNLMQRLAQNGNGNAAYIDTLNEAHKVLVEEAGSTLFPIAKDVKIQVEFNPEMVSEYRLIGYETRALNREDFNNDKVDAGDIGSGHTVTAIYEITPKGSDSQLVDDLKYQPAETDKAAHGDEYATLKIRYKLPKEDASRLITQPITVKEDLDYCAPGHLCEPAGIPDDIKFATAVAAFGQILKGGEYTGSYTLDDVINLAQGAKGEDKFGYRAEFINLVRLAKTAQDMQQQ